MMTKRMERQRVLYSAKTKTSQVIPTSSSRRPLSLPASFPAEEHPAPLASVESDSVVSTKRGNEISQHSSLSLQYHRPTSVGSVCRGKTSNTDVMVWERDNLNKELFSSRSSWGSIKTSNSKSCDVQKYSLHYRESEQTSRLRSESVSHVQSLETATSGMDTGSDSNLSVVKNNAHQSSQNQLHRKAVNSSLTTHDRSIERKRKLADHVTVTEANTDRQREQKAVVKIAPPVAPKPKASLHLAGGNVSASSNQHLKARVLESSPIVVRKEVGATSKENCIVASERQQLQHEEDTSKTCRRKVFSVQKPEDECLQSDCYTSSSMQKHAQRQLAISTDPVQGSASILLPEMKSPVKSSEGELSSLPEMCSLSTSAEHSPVISPQATAPCQCRAVLSNSSHRKPLSAMHISSNTPENGTEDGSEQRSGCSRPSTDTSRRSRQPKDHETRPITIQPVNTEVTCTASAGQVSYHEPVPFLVSEFKPRWKRNSMRLATQGYTSMSDLTQSLECVLGCEDDPSRSGRCHSPTDMFDGKQGEQVPHEANQTDNRPDIEKTDWERNKHINTIRGIYVTNEDLKELRVDFDADDSNSWNEDCLDRIERNGINRLSYRMATSGLNYVWILEADRRRHRKSNDLSPVTEKCDVHTESRHLNLSPVTEKCDVHTELRHLNLSPVTEKCDVRTEPRHLNLSPVTDKCDVHTEPHHLNLSPVTEKCDVHRGPHRLSSTQVVSSQDLVSPAPPCVASNFLSVSAASVDGSRHYSSTSSCDNKTDQHISESNRKDQDDQQNKTKRWSYMLATNDSLSNLTFLVDDLDCTNSGPPSHEPDHEQNNTHSVISPSQTITHCIREPQHGQTIATGNTGNDYCPFSKRTCSGRNHENKNSVLHTMSLDLKESICLNTELKELPSVYPSHLPLDSTDPDSSGSGTTSCYYSASPDTSFMTADGDPLNNSCSHDARKWSPGQRSQHSSQRSPGQLARDHTSQRLVPQTHSSPSLASKGHTSTPPPLSSQDKPPPQLHARAKPSSDRPLQDLHSTPPRRPDHRRTLDRTTSRHQKELPTQRHEYELSWCDTNKDSMFKQTTCYSSDGKLSKHSSSVNNVLQCYGCGLTDRQPSKTPCYLNVNNSKGTLGPGRNTDLHSRTHRRHYDNPRSAGTAKMSSERHGLIYPASLPESVHAHGRKCSGDTGVFMKDHSSTSGIPSTLSFSSLTSFTDDMALETTPRFPPSLGRPRRKLYAGFDSQPLPMDSFISDSSSVFSIQSCSSWGASRSAEVEKSANFPGMSPNIRSVSSVAYGSTRSLTDEEEVHKHMYLYNLYPRVNSSLPTDGVKDGYHEKSASSESLQSFLSEATTIGENQEHKTDGTQQSQDYSSCEELLHKVNAMVVHSEPRMNGRSGMGRLANGSGYLLDRINRQPSDGVQQKIHDVSSCTPSHRPRALSKAKYLSSRDILDCILMPDKNSKKAVANLERQAQKMYEVILCCNEMDLHPSREYHF